jgi:hypothetical protein
MNEKQLHGLGGALWGFVKEFQLHETPAQRRTAALNS